MKNAMMMECFFRMSAGDKVVEIAVHHCAGKKLNLTINSTSGVTTEKDRNTHIITGLVLLHQSRHGRRGIAHGIRKQRGMVR